MQSSILIKGVAYTLKLPVKHMIACEASIAPLTLAKVFTPIKGFGNAVKASAADMELPGIEVMAKIMYSCLLDSYPEMTMDKTCDLIGQYFEEAHDMATAQVTLFMVLGQATGFFNVAENPQSIMTRALNKQARNKNGSSAKE